MRGCSARSHAWRANRAGMGAVAARTPAGTTPPRSWRPRQVSAYAVTSRSRADREPGGEPGDDLADPGAGPEQRSAVERQTDHRLSGVRSDLERFVLDRLDEAAEARRAPAVRRRPSRSTAIISAAVAQPARKPSSTRRNRSSWCRAAERHADADDEPDAPGDERATVAEQRDQRLGEGEGEDEQPRCPSEQQSEVDGCRG